MRLRALTTTAALTAAGAVLSLAACHGSTTDHASSPTTPPAVARSVPAGPPASERQLDTAALATSDVAKLRVGVTDADPDSTLVSNASGDSSDTAACEPFMNIWQDGRPEYHIAASVDRRLLDAGATVPATGQLHLASYPAKDAAALVSSLQHAVASCHHYVHPDPSGPINETITPATRGETAALAGVGDQAVAWHTTLTSDGHSLFASLTVVRVGSTVITAVDLSDQVSSAAALPLPAPAVLKVQADKLRATLR